VSDTVKLTGDSKTDLAAVANSLRSGAENMFPLLPLFNTLTSQWAEGFLDGMKFCSVVIDLFATDGMTQEQFLKALDEAMKK